MKAAELVQLGVPKHGSMEHCFKAIGKDLGKGKTLDEVRSKIKAIVTDPENFIKDEIWGDTAFCIIKYRSFTPREEPIEYRQWGDDIEKGSIDQIKNACKLPVARKAALMADSHQGYGLPIGGVLATENSVIPYAVGVDISCMMKVTVLDLPVGFITGGFDKLKNALERETEFGMGSHFRKPREHDVMDEDWSVTKVTQDVKDKAWSQLGTSGSGNHFVEFGEFKPKDNSLGLEEDKTYLALLSHSGSRGAGAKVANHYSKLAMAIRKGLPKELIHLAWLDLDTEEGEEYWDAMNLMGKYAAANHAVIHKMIAKNLGAKVLLDIENYHNFAWKEIHDGKEYVVHRKGATPAGKGELGIIPGSMLDPAFVVRGKGNEDSLRSASHGAGRKMSRRQAREKFTWSNAKKRLKAKNVVVLSAGLDEVPMAYKNIHEVMKAQEDLVETIGEFQPKIVKMAPDGEKPED